jgi:3-methylcrotonyl-CoA carboxylase beta subunit
MLMIHDATVKGGTYYGITSKKHVRAQMFAWQHRLPCITMVQSGGANLPEQANIFPRRRAVRLDLLQPDPHVGRGHHADRRPCTGPSTAGGAYLPALCDEAVIVRNQGAMFLGGPQLVYAATKEVVDVETLGGGDMHSRVSGVTDHLAESDSHAIAIVRGIVANLGTAPSSAGTWPQRSRRASTRARSTASSAPTTAHPHRQPRDAGCG